MDPVLPTFLGGLAVAATTYASRATLVPGMRKAWRRLRLKRDCRHAVEALRAELTEDIDRLAAASLARTERTDDGRERAVYRFGREGASRRPELPTLRRTAFDRARLLAPSCLGSRAGLMDDSAAALDRYQAIDLDRFRDAWNAAMNPGMQRMMMGDPGHLANRTNMKKVVDVDRQMTRTRASLEALLAALPG
jgi:hypothetical protein